MKRNLLSMFAVAAGLLMATSCSTKQEEEVTTGGEAVVTFTAQLPSGLGSRAPQKTTEDGGTTTTTFGDGNTATRLQYAVYKVTEDAVNGAKWELISDLSKDTKTLSDRKATVSLQLVNGNTYAVAFWADVEKESIYSFSKEEFKITADYTTKTPTSSNESYDAFYAVKTFKVEGSSQMPVELKRPFAQLNIGTADLDESKDAGYDVKQAAVTVKTYSTFDLKNDDVVGDATEVTFALADLPSTEKFPVDNYSYLTMNYLLMPSDKQADNTVTISYDEASGVQKREFTNVPLQRNYRTNIYGNLLTSTTQFNVVINSEFDGEMGFVFSVAANKTVVFSKGNLQYTQSNNTWSFAEHQYDFIGADNVTSDSKLADKIDLFGWSGSAGPEWGISTSVSTSDYSGDFVDWGQKMAGYRTLTYDEWYYLLYTRTNASDRQGVACIKWGDGDTDYTNGLILLPDCWVCPEDVTFKSGCASDADGSKSEYYGKHQTFKLAEWEELEKAGAVFLPASGVRYGGAISSDPWTGVSTLQKWGYYWSATVAENSNCSYVLFVTSNGPKLTDGQMMTTNLRMCGSAVRLVKDF